MLIMAAVVPFQYSFNPEISFFELRGSAQLIVFIFSVSLKAVLESIRKLLHLVQFSLIFFINIASKSEKKNSIEKMI